MLRKPETDDYPNWLLTDEAEIEEGVFDDTPSPDVPIVDEIRQDVFAHVYTRENLF